MKALRVTQDGKITLSAELRRMAGIEAGQQLIAVPSGRTIVLTPVESADALRGVARGADTSGYRDRSDAQASHGPRR